MRKSVNSRHTLPFSSLFRFTPPGIMSASGVWPSLRRDPLSILCRKKPVDMRNEAGLLRRTLTVVDLFLLEVGFMIGAGIFVVVGSSIRDKAGPGVLVSYVVAGVPSFISALCYAEFGARVPRAGSSYDYVYVALGEFWAALVGWYTVSSSIFGMATYALSWSSYFDTLFDNWIRNSTVESVPWFDSPYLSRYPDFVACGMILLLSAVVAAGAKTSAWINNVFSSIKLIVIVFIVGYGFSFAQFRHWTDWREGGFFPYGVSGVISAASNCFLSFVGFEVATMAGEEVANPRKSIVVATGSAFVVVTLAYILMCASLTLMLPYTAISPSASFADAFQQRGADWAKYVVAIGALSALTTVQFGAIFCLPRYAYAVSSDGLLFRWLGRVNERTGVPVLAVTVSALIAVLVALLFDLNVLIEFLSMGNLLCYTLVTASVVVMRYRPATDPGPGTNAGRLKTSFRGTLLEKLFGNFQPGAAVTGALCIQCGIMVICSAVIAYASWDSPLHIYVFGTILALSAIVLLGVQLLILTFEKNPEQDLWFKVPLVPVFPSIGMFINILMVLHLAPMTWLRFGIYHCLGALVYFFYGIRHSGNKIAPMKKTAHTADREKELTKL